MDGEKVLTLDEAKKIFLRMRDYPDYTVYVAETDGIAAGTFALAIMDNMAHMGKKSGLIEDFVVLRSHRRRGVGRAMINRAVGICRAKSCYKVALSSNIKRNEAREFYESLGFKIHGYSFVTELE